MQKTLILLKPDAMTKKVCGKVISRFEDAGYTIRGCKMLQLTPELLREHYAHIADMPFFPEVEEFMGSTPVIAIALEGENIIDEMREMLGVTNCLDAAEGTIRAMYGSKDEGTSKMHNICHASDSPEAAEVEVKRFFSEDELFSY